MAAVALPGEELVVQGMRDLARRIESVDSLLVSLAASRLARYGDGAHGHYNSLLRRMVSYQRAAACAK